jgi:hypothetical protein
MQRIYRLNVWSAGVDNPILASRWHILIQRQFNEGYPARCWNNKTIIATIDDFMQKINDGTILDDVVFELYHFDNNSGDVIKQTYCSA